MSALYDRSQKIAFYFGNAEKGLAHLLPPMNEKNESSEILSLLNRAESSLEELLEQRRLLSYLIADLKRMIS